MREKINTQEMAAKKRPFFMDAVVFTTCFFLGGIGYYAGYQLELFPSSQQFIIESLRWIYEQIGIVSIGLIPLTFFLASMIFLIFLERVDLFSFQNSPAKKLDFIVEVGPMLGIVGTMISLSKAMLEVDISHGVQVAINNMTALIGQALNSSIYGIVLALAAYMMKSFCKRKWGEQNENASVDI
jgi:hypothetical protein